MHIWKAPAGSKVQLWLSSRDLIALNAQAAAREAAGLPRTTSPNMSEVTDKLHYLRTSLFRRLRLKPNTRDLGVTLALDDPRWDPLVAALRAHQASGDLVPHSCLVQEAPHTPDDPHAWFSLKPADQLDLSERPPPRHHFRTDYYSIAATSSFIDAVRAAGLSGLGVLPLERHAPRGYTRWFHVYGEHPPGIALHHPLTDIAKQREDARQGRLQARRHPFATAYSPYIRTDITLLDPLFPDLLAIGLQYLSFESHRELLRESLPPTDFAYDFARHMFHDPKGPRFGHGLMCNARARRCLLDAGVMPESDFTPIATTAKSDATTREVPDLASLPPRDPPRWTPETAAIERADREVRLARNPIPEPPVPLRFANVDQALQYIKHRLASGKAQWKPASEDDRFDRILAAPEFQSLPKAWRSLAALLPMFWGLTINGRDVDFCMERPNFGSPGADPDPDADHEIPTNDAVAFASGDGDWFSTHQSDPAMPHDSVVTFWCHEEDMVLKRWPSVLDFVIDLIGPIEPVR